MSLLKLYEVIGWPLHEDNDNVLDLLYLSLHDEELAFSKYNIPERIQAALMTTIRTRLKIRPVRVKSSLRIQHFGSAATELIRSAARASLDAIPAGSNSHTKFVLDSPPLFHLECSSLKKEEAVRTVETVIKNLRQNLDRVGGVFAQVGKIQISSGQ